MVRSRYRRDPCDYGRTAPVSWGAGAAQRQMTVHAFGVGGLGVLREVDAGCLFFGADPEAHRPLDHRREDERHRERVDRDDNDREGLLA